MNKRKEVNFVLKDVIDTSKEIIDNLFSSSVKLDIDSNIDNIEVFKGKYFISLVDCFKIFFENIVNYSKDNNQIQADICINIVDYDDYIECDISNELVHTDEKNFIIIDEHIKEKVIEIQNATNSIANRKEGNTGIVKATRILKIALNNMKNDLRFQRLENQIYIKMKIYKRGLIHENINS